MCGKASWEDTAGRLPKFWKKTRSVFWRSLGGLVRPERWCEASACLRYLAGHYWKTLSGACGRINSQIWLSSHFSICVESGNGSPYRYWNITCYSPCPWSGKSQEPCTTWFICTCISAFGQQYCWLNSRGKYSWTTPRTLEFSWLWLTRIHFFFHTVNKTSDNKYSKLQYFQASVHLSNKRTTEFSGLHIIWIAMAHSDATTSPQCAHSLLLTWSCDDMMGIGTLLSPTFCHMELGHSASYTYGNGKPVPRIKREAKLVPIH